MARPFKCPYCRSIQTTWKGYRVLAKGRVRLRKCKQCGRKFTPKVYEKTMIQDDFSFRDSFCWEDSVLSLRNMGLRKQLRTLEESIQNKLRELERILDLTRR